jgi:hypothetical protein
MSPTPDGQNALFCQLVKSDLLQNTVKVTLTKLHDNDNDAALSVATVGEAGSQFHILCPLSWIEKMLFVALHMGCRCSFQ